jgi:hypothetical protein
MLKRHLKIAENGTPGAGLTSQEEVTTHNNNNGFFGYTYYTSYTV